MLNLSYVNLRKNFVENKLAKNLTSKLIFELYISSYLNFKQKICKLIKLKNRI